MLVLLVPAMPQTRKPQSEVIQGMSQRMLEGYKLLSKHCPMEGCNTPLLQSRDGEMWCAGRYSLTAPGGGRGRGCR